jgi:hypothetical protein
MIFSAIEREGPKESLYTTHKIEEESEISFFSCGSDHRPGVPLPSRVEK